MECKLGHGVFQENESIAVKMESKKTRPLQLFYEYRVLKILTGIQGIPKVLSFHETSETNEMKMELLGPSLEHLLQLCHQKFTLKTVLMIGIQILQRLQSIHSKCFIHRDVKPENFVILKDMIYMIDFGLAMKYCHPKTLQHVDYSENRKFVGTLRFASLYAQMGLKQCRRDDMISLGYMLIYFIRGSLPWQKKQEKRILHKKMMISNNTLTKGLDESFLKYFMYCDELKFESKPNYDYLIDIFRDALNRNQSKNNNVFDWNLLARTSWKCKMSNMFYF